MHTRTIGGFAFPRVVPNTLENSGFNYDSGMTLRDYFAAKAMAGAAASNTPYNSCEEAAQDAYAMADAMLKEREK